MCGIAGFQGAFGEALLREMSASIAHRGPDADAAIMLRCDDASVVGFGHRRLAIIDLSVEGCQPMTVQCDVCGAQSLRELALIFNGEIYNFPELRADLISAGHAFHSDTDSEVLLHLYASEGIAMLERLNGIFAFAIYDGRESGRSSGVARGDVFLARDQMGVKPLYYAQTDEGVLFASEMKALLQHRTLSRELDLTAVHEYLAYLWTPAPRTMLKSVRKLEPGHAQQLSQGRIVREWCYYDIPYGRPSLTGSRAEIASELREKVATAVERQLIADVPVGAFLSGGLDSSAVVALAEQSRNGVIARCYSIGFEADLGPDGSPADLPYARKVAAHLGVPLTTIEVKADVIDNLERMIFHLDEPQADPAPINSLLISERARADGITVLLSGTGGDDIFSGYRRHQALRFDSAIAAIPSGVRSAIGRATRGGGTMGRRVAKMLEHSELRGDARMASYFWWSPSALRQSLYSPALTDELQSADAASPLLESLRRIPDEQRPLHRMLYLEAKHFLADHNLNYTDKTGMAAGVEIRVPLLDIELVDFATRIPPDYKQTWRTGKSIFKQAMEPLLPHDVIYRPKSGFGAPLRRWLREELRNRVEDTLSDASIRRRGLFDPKAVHDLIALDRAGKVDGAYTIFALMCMEIWCRLFIDVPVPVKP
jgi:asparagine synthase (glutamine-hydrolysing)